MLASHFRWISTTTVLALAIGIAAALLAPTPSASRPQFVTVWHPTGVQDDDAFCQLELSPEYLCAEICELDINGNLVDTGLTCCVKESHLAFGDPEDCVLRVSGQ